MKYWDITDTYLHDVEDGQSIIAPGWPAAWGLRKNANRDLVEAYEIEIVPNSVREEMYFNPASFVDENTLVVDTIRRIRKAGEQCWNEEYFIIDLASFGINPDKIGYANKTNKLAVAYDRAMKGI